MAFYDFKREDGEWTVKSFPIGQCPSEITDDDGVKAKRGWRPDSIPAVKWKEGQEPIETLRQMNRRRTQDNINAGNRGRDEWRERMPKLACETE